MKHIILVVLGLIWAGVVSAQINIVDKGDVFEVYATGQFRSSTPKGLAYIQVDAQGRLGLLRAANGSQITSYANIAAYRVNGVQYGTLEELVSALQVAIFVLPCLAEDTTCTYSVEGIELEPFVCVTFEEGFDTYQVSTVLFSVSATDGISASNTGEINNFQDFIQALENQVSITNTDSNFSLSYSLLENGICLKGNRTTIGNLSAAFTITSVRLNGTTRVIGDGWNVLTNLNSASSTPPLLYNFTWIFLNLPYQFQVNINGSWVDQTAEVSNGTWSLTTTDTVTEWRIIDANENVIDSDTLICNQ